MRPSHPPIVATWLLENCTFGVPNHALLGDLAEEYADGRSAFWFWRQALAALLINFGRGVRAHPVFALRGLLTGWLVLLLTQSAKDHLLHSLPRPLIAQLSNSYPLAFGSYNLFPNGLFWSALTVLVAMFSGAIVACLHRSYRAPMVLLFCVTVFLWNLRGMPWLCTLAVDSLSNTRYVPYLAYGIMAIFLAPIGILIGGFRTGALSGIRHAGKPRAVAS